MSHHRIELVLRHHLSTDSPATILDPSEIFHVGARILTRPMRIWRTCQRAMDGVVPLIIVQAHVAPLKIGLEHAVVQLRTRACPRAKLMHRPKPKPFICAHTAGRKQRTMLATSLPCCILKVRACKRTAFHELRACLVRILIRHMQGRLVDCDAREDRPGERAHEGHVSEVGKQVRRVCSIRLASVTVM